MTVVLHSSALLAISFREPGSEIVADELPVAVISSVNLTEAVTKLIDKGDLPELASESINAFDIPVMPFTEAQSIDAGLLRTATRPLGLSLGDRACLALARALGAPVLTADRAWAALDVGVEIRVIR